MATEGLPPDRVPQDLRRQTLSQLEEAIRNYPGVPPAANLQNPADVETKLFEQSRNTDEYTAKLQRILFVITKRKSLQNLAQNPQQQTSGAPSLSQQGSTLQPPQQQSQQLGGGAGGGVSYSVSGSNMAGVNAAGMGMNRPMQQMQPGGMGAGGGYPQVYHTTPQQHIQHHPHYIHRGGGGTTMSAMQPGMHPGQKPVMAGGGGQPMMHGGGYGHPHMPMHNYPQNYQPHYNPAMSGNAMGQQRQPPSINPSLIRQQPPMITHGGMRPGMMGGGGGYAGGPIMQSQVPTGYAADINSSVQPVMAVPNPSYLPASSVSGLRQPAPPYDSVQPPASSVGVPSSVTASSALSFSSSSSTAAPTSQSQPSSLSHSHPPSTTATITSTTSASSLGQPVPSPAPPTPLLPASPAPPSVGSPAHSTVTPEENEAYLRTHHELQMYVPLLNRMMNRMVKREGEEAQKSEQYMKLKSLHSLLQDDKKRVPLPTLIKCKTALEKMFEQQQLREQLDSTSTQPPPSNPPSVTPTPGQLPPTPLTNATIIDPPMPISTKPLPEPKSQSLLEFKMIPSPTPTLGNLIDTCSIQSHPFPADRLPPSKRLCNRVEPVISPGLRREIAHLVRFRVHPLSRADMTQRGTMLECSIVDENLPPVPSLTVCIPPGYPDTSPECNLDSYLNSTPLHMKIGNLLSDTLARCCDSYTLSFLLSSWETSLLRALALQF